MPFINFEIVNAKNIKMEFKKQLKYGISIHWGFNLFFFFNRVCEQNQGNKIKDSGEAWFWPVYWCSPLNAIWNENSARLFFYLELKHKI